MENQEQNSQSESTKSDIAIVTEAMATPFRSIVPLDYNQLRADFDEYWDMHGHLIERKFKFKGRKGKKGKSKRGKDYLEKTVGYTKLYGEVLWHAAAEKLDDPIFFNSIHLEKFTPEQTLAVCVYYKRPTLDLKEEIDFKVRRKVEYDTEKAWEDRLKEVQREHRSVSTNTTGDPIKDDQQVLLDLTASCEGEPYPAATAQGKWLDVSSIIVKSLREGLTKHKLGDLFEVSFEDEKKKQVDIQVKVHAVNDIHNPYIDDELAKDAGFDSLEDLKAHFYEEYENYVKNAEESQACDHILTEIITKSEIGPIPNEYVIANADQYMKDAVHNHKGDLNKAIRSLGAKDEEGLKRLFFGQVHRDLYQKLAVRYYAEKYELDPKDTKSILKDMRERVDWYIVKNEQDKM